MPTQTASNVSRAVANLLRLADSDLKDAELLSSGRHPGNAPTLLHLASERLYHAVVATEHGWPFAKPGSDLTLIPAANPLREAVSNLVIACRDRGPPTVPKDGSPPSPPNPQELRANILAARAVLKTLAATFEVDLFGVGVAGRISPVRPGVVPVPKQDQPAAKPEAKQPPPARVASQPDTQKAAPRPIRPAEPPTNVHDLPRPRRIALRKSAPTPAPEPHEVEGRASIEVKQGSTSIASTPFWTLMDRWHISDQAALDLLGHPGGLTKKGTRPRFKLAGEEAALFRGFQEIDAALQPLGLEPKTWLHQPIKTAPFDGATPAATLTSGRKQGVQDILRFILQHGLRLSMSNQRRAE